MSSHKHLHTLLVIVVSAHQLFADELPVQIDEKEVILHCPNRLSIEKTKITWFKMVEKEWKNVEQINTISYLILDNGDLFIKNLDLNHDGEYLCSHKSDFGEEKHVMSLVVRKRKKTAFEHDKPIKGTRKAVWCQETDDPLSFKIDWRLNDTVINFKNEPNLIKKSDDKSRHNSRNYRRIVSTDLKEMNARGVPNAPSAQVTCFPLEALIEWESNGDNGACIQKYTIEYLTSADSSKMWQILTQFPSKNPLKFTIPMILRWTNYTFRVIAHNRLGSSPPSASTQVCTSESDGPYENPQGVRAEGTTPTNMVISWTPLPPHKHNGSGFYYKVCWRQFLIEKWNCSIVTDWRQNQFIVDELPTFVRYEIKIKSGNDIDETYTDEIFFGYSGEGIPIRAPNFSLVNITGFETVILRWTPVPSETVNGNITDYVIHIWNDIDGPENVRRLAVKNGIYQIEIKKLRRATVHYTQIFVRNRLYSGPKSEILQFMTPLPDPSSVQSIEAHPLGSSAFLLKWTKPLKIDGQLIGYNIYYGNISGIRKYERIPQINDPNATRAKLHGLIPNTIYRLHIIPVTDGIDGNDYFIVATTNPPKIPTKPDQPSFSWEILSSNEINMKVRVNWKPNFIRNPGSHFFVKYRIKGEQNWTDIDPTYADDYVTVNSLSSSETYQFQVVSVDGDQMANSDIQEVVLESSSFPFNNQSIIVTIVAVVSLSSAVALGVTRLILQRQAKNRAIREQRMNSHNSSNGENMYQINPKGDLNFIFNQCRVSQPTIETKHSIDTDPTVVSYRMNCVRTIGDTFDDSINGNPNKINPDVVLDRQAETLSYDQKYEFPRDKLELGKLLGTGAFGVVHEAKAYGILPNEDQTTVAVKTVEKMADIEVFRAFVLELKIMIHLGKHLNIVNLLGAVTKNVADRELMIIVEHCEFGNLQSFLVKNRQHFIDQIIAEDDRIDPNIKCRKVKATNEYLIHTSQAPASARSITTTDLLIWSFQIARGMHYLASRKVLHGDLAARNILLCEENVVKICDFGLARSMYKTGNYLIKTERLLPYKWLAPESIGDHVFSTYSDVWSFGIVLWELFSLGAVPYPLTAGASLFKMLKEGYRMECPDFATQAIYNIMLSCWDETPELRPLFDELTSKFSKMLDQNVSKQYISLNEPHSKENENRLKSSQPDYLKLINSPKSSQIVEAIVSVNHQTYCALDETKTFADLSTLPNFLQFNGIEDSDISNC